MHFSFLSIFLFVCFYPVIPILCVMLRNETKPKKNIILGVTLPYDARESEAVLALCAQFRRNMNIAFVLLTLAGLAHFLIPYISVVTTYDMLWLIAGILVPFFVYARANRKLRRLKAEQGWSSAYAGKTLVDLEAAALPKRTLRVWWFIPPIVVSLVPCAVTLWCGRGQAEFWYLFVCYLSFAVLAGVCYALYRIICRQPAEVIDGRTALSVALTQVRRYNWGKSLIALSWLTGLYSIVFWLLLERSTIGLLVATAVYTLALLWACLRAEFATRRAQEKLTAQSGVDDYVDDDVHWPLGMFYYNEHDSHFMKNSRVGMNTTVNLARPGAKVLMGFAALCLAAMPFVGVWMMVEEFTPVDVYCTDTEIVAAHTGRTYTVPFDAIVSAQVIDTLPPMKRVAGIGMDNLCKGKFRVEGYGLCRLCLDPRDAQFLVLTTVETTYILSADAETIRAVVEDGAVPSLPAVSP